MIDASRHRHFGVVNIDAVNGIAERNHLDVFLMVKLYPVFICGDLADLLDDAILEAHFSPVAVAGAGAVAGAVAGAGGYFFHTGTLSMDLRAASVTSKISIA